MNEERIVIVGYRPFAGKENKLSELIRTHVDTLRKEGLATDRKSIIMQSKNGTIIEVFGWRSKEAIASAHSNATVAKMWEEFSEVCEYTPVGDLEESKDLFSEFMAMN